ncbi:MAG: hypothetical protein HS104_17905 [Polyangiaceae bacterium]|nr:hypothetical protein [Polyangiaceae bacterium]MCE7889389.1 hypothetical protein [Sorangiineae bacterium PRO1]MCL4753381.1 hypothetical protein [Myxococcales bacterium]
MKRWPLALVLASSAHAAAQVPPPHAAGVEHPPQASYWERGLSRPFASASLELGFAYARPEVSVGFGRPFYRAMSLDAKPLVTSEGAGFYGGVRGTVPFLELRAGVRKFEAFDHKLLGERDHHERAELELPRGPEAEPLSLESELSGAVSIPGGGPFWLLGVYHVTHVDPGFHLYEESLKVIVDPPWLWRLRVGYAWRFGRNEAIRIGVAEEILQSPGRPSYVIRAGVVGSVAIEENVDVQLTLLPVLHSPDSLGLAGADFGHLGVRWRWATASSKRRNP